MKKTIVLLLIAVTAISCQKKEYKTLSPTETIKRQLVEDYADYSKKVNELNVLANGKIETQAVQNKFRETRLAYKRIESFITFYFPETAKSLNGAAIDENDTNETSRKLEEASGFQKVEELLFSDETDVTELRKQIGILNGYSQSLNNNIQNLQLTDSNIFEAQKLQMVRLMSLGISGFDSPIAFHSLPETTATIESISKVISSFKADEKFNTVIGQAENYLAENQDFNSFDRADFIVNHCIPISNAIHKIQSALKIKSNDFIGAIDLDKQNIFEEDAFNVDYFAPFYNRKPSKNQVALGEQLFFDPILSGDNKISCATCHIPSQGYADHKPKAVENGNLSRNTPTLLNSAFQNTLFLDGRVTYLEDQAKAVINNRDEMHGSFIHALEKVKNNAKYKSEFRKVFPKEAKITEQNLLKSLASYVRSLSKLDSKFDNYLRGKSSLTSNEKNGFNLYMGKAKCATCHFFPLFNGSVPPLYNKVESEVLGVPSQKAIANAHIDPDLGEYNYTKAPLKKHAFKTLTVRNSAITFPYMHNGVYQTLEEVIDFYNRGGGAGIGISLEHQTLPSDKLNLSEKEIRDLVAFIKTLNNPEAKPNYLAGTFVKHGK
nr:cytochrome c peroxidase [uncultured Flavobacterium sp.]